MSNSFTFLLLLLTILLFHFRWDFWLCVFLRLILSFSCLPGFISAPSCLCVACSFLMHLHLNNRVTPPIYYCMSVKLKLHLHDLFLIWPFLVLFFWITVIKWSHLKQLILQKKKPTISCTFKTLGDMVNSQYLHRGLKNINQKKGQVKYSVNKFISHRC